MKSPAKTSDTAGDGTTTATVPAEAIYREGLKNVTLAASPISLQRGIQKAVDAAVEHLGQDPASIPRTRKRSSQVATVSANRDTTIGEIIADAMDKVGKDGTITVEEAKSIEIPRSKAEAGSSTRAILALLRNANAEAMEAKPADIFGVLNYEKKITSLNTLAPDPGEGGLLGKTAADHRRGRGRRGSARHPRGEQTPRHAQHLRRQGPGFRRSPQVR